MTTRSWLLAVVLVLIGWVGVQAAVMRASDIAPGAIALFPKPGFAANLPADIAIVGLGTFWIAVRYDGPDLAKTLYSKGARLVLPAGLPGCLSLPKST